MRALIYIVMTREDREDNDSDVAQWGDSPKEFPKRKLIKRWRIIWFCYFGGVVLMGYGIVKLAVPG